MLAALAFVALAMLRPRLGLPAWALAALLAAGCAAAGWWGGHGGKAIAAEAAAACLAAFGSLRLHDEAPPDRLTRTGLLLVGAAALWSLPPLAASIAVGARALDRPDLVEVQAARISMHFPTTWRASEAGTTRTLAPREGGDAWLTLREPTEVGAGDIGLKVVLAALAGPRGAVVQPKVRGELSGYQVRTLEGDAKLVFWGCEAFRGASGQALLLEYGVARSSADPRKRIRDLEAILATLQPGD